MVIVHDKRNAVENCKDYTLNKIKVKYTMTIKQEICGERSDLCVLVCGGRNFNDSESVFKILDAVHVKLKIREIVNGAARGADKISSDWAQKNSIRLKEYPAMWNEFGPSAGPIRNSRMISENQIDLVVAFPGGKGTRDMIKKSRSAGIKVLEVDESCQ